MNSILKILIALIFVSTGSFLFAVEKKSLTSEQKLKFQYYFLESLRQKELGNFAAAADNLFRCYNIDADEGIIFSELAQLNTTLSKIDNAVIYMRKAVSMEPDNIYCKQALGQLLLQQNDLAEAAKVYEELLKKDKKNNRINYYVLASIYTELQHPKKAIDAWLGLEEEIGINDKVTIEIFKSYLTLKKEKKAFAEINKLIKAFPKETKYRALKGDLYLVVEKTGKGESCYQEALRIFPNDPLLTFRHGLFLMETGKKENGLSKLTSLFSNEKADFDIKKEALNYMTEDTSVHVGDSIYLGMIEKYPEEEFPYLIYASALLKNNDEEGFKYIRKALSINPKYQNSWNSLISYYSERNDTISTIAACQEALDHFPDNAEFLYLLGEAQLKNGKQEETLDAWKKSITSSLAQYNNNMASLVSGVMGDLYIKMGNTDDGYKAYDSALAYNANNIIVMNNYAYYLSLENKNLKKAESMSGKTVKLDPKNPVFLDTYAWIFFKMGEYKMALLYIEQAYTNGGKTDADVLEHYGDILYKAGESKEAYQQKWQEALNLLTEKKKDSNSKDYIRVKRKAEKGIYVE